MSRDGEAFVLVPAVGFLDRLRGFLVSRPKGCVLMIAPCCSIHTFGMKHPLDVAFCARDGTVVRSLEKVVPGRLVRCPRACAVLEREWDPGNEGNWYREGEEIAICIGR